jgi:hypothetical protein
MVGLACIIEGMCTKGTYDKLLELCNESSDTPERPYGNNKSTDNEASIKHPDDRLKRSRLKRLLQSLRLIQSSVVLVSILTISITTSAPHVASASSHSSHTSPKSSHNNQQAMCVSACATVYFSRSDEDIVEDENDEDGPLQGMFIPSLLRSSILSYIHSSVAARAQLFSPPPGPPTYILYSVYRV